MPVTETKRRNQTVDGLADCAPPLTETPEISRVLDSRLLTTEAIRTVVSTMTIDLYSADRPTRDLRRSPFQRILPRSRRMLACARVRISSCNPSSIAARFVRDRLLFIAWRIKRSSISMLVRILFTFHCLKIPRSSVALTHGSHFRLGPSLAVALKAQRDRPSVRFRHAHPHCPLISWQVRCAFLP
jgi:hypothetical protein